ncbi:MAG TPA: carboxypeptidase-like regulatory domain-containing protein, partial [Gemmatirosa sp.]
LVWASPALAQTGTITGRVVDSTTQQPLPGATIRLNGTERGASTREDGSFTLTAVPTGQQQLRVSRIGYAAQLSPITVSPGGNTLPPVRLRQLAATLAPVVAVGYGTVRREATTASVSSVNTSEARVGVQPNVNNLIEGRAAGVQVTSNSGDPGANSQVRIRGGTSITSSDDPLYVIDGIPLLNNATVTPGPGSDGNTAPLNRSPLNTINPEDIADITILKDAAATAIYGSRAANGVILITTKRGVAGASSSEYDGYYAAATQARKYDLLSGDQYRSFVAGQATLGNLPASASSALGSANTDWQSAVDRTANIQNHNVAFSGGSQTTQYRASVNYFDNPAIVQGNYLTRIAGRLNGSTRLLGDKLGLNVNLNPSQERDRYLVAENTGGFLGGTLLNTLVFNPTYPVSSNTSTTGYYEQGPGAQNNRNPVALASNLQDRATVSRILGNAQAQYQFLPALSGTVNVGVDQSSGARNSFYPNSNPLGAETGGLAQNGQLNATTQTINTYLTYDKQFNTGFL